jgi:N-ethylmaleimide reductase
MKLFSEYQLGNITLKNRIVMAPMTRSRAIGNVPNETIATYYGQRATAGLIISEGTAPSPNGLGYARIPGIFNQEQVEGWKLITDALHAKGGLIFIQLMHTGRVSVAENLPAGAEVLAPSAVQLEGTMWTDANGMQPYPTPKEMTAADIEATIEEYVTASKNAIAAGFDGVELHGANGYLIEQFLNTATNQRSDNYGGSATNRNRFAIEVATKVAAAIGADKTAMRVSPYGVFNGIAIHDGLDAQYTELAAALGKIGLVYLHNVDHSSQGAPAVPEASKKKLQEAFGGTFIYSGGLDKASAEAVLEEGRGDLVAFGRPFLANPDLVARLQDDLELAHPDYSKLYTPGADGYNDYPATKISIA